MQHLLADILRLPPCPEVAETLGQCLPLWLALPAALLGLAGGSFILVFALLVSGAKKNGLRTACLLLFLLAGGLAASSWLWDAHALARVDKAALPAGAAAGLELLRFHLHGGWVAPALGALLCILGYAKKAALPVITALLLLPASLCGVAHGLVLVHLETRLVLPHGLPVLPSPAAKAPTAAKPPAETQSETKQAPEPEPEKPAEPEPEKPKPYDGIFKF